MNTPTFVESFCALHTIPREQFARAVFQRALYRRALPFVRVLRLFKSDYFVADFDLIYGVEHLRRVRDFNTEVERFNEHPANRGWLRRQLGIRVSTNRLKQLIKATLPASSARRGSSRDTAVPYQSGSGSGVDFMPLAKS